MSHRVFQFARSMLLVIAAGLSSNAASRGGNFGDISPTSPCHVVPDRYSFEFHFSVLDPLQGIAGQPNASCDPSTAELDIFDTEGDHVGGNEDIDWDGYDEGNSSYYWFFGQSGVPGPGTYTLSFNVDIKGPIPPAGTGSIAYQYDVVFTAFGD